MTTYIYMVICIFTGGTLNTVGIFRLNNLLIQIYLGDMVSSFPGCCNYHNKMHQIYFDYPLHIKVVCILYCSPLYV